MIKSIVRKISFNHAFKEKYDNLVIQYLRNIKLNEIERSLSIRKLDFKIDELQVLLFQLRNENTNNKHDVFKIINELPNLVSRTTPVGREKDSKVLKIHKVKENEFSKYANQIGRDLSQLRTDGVYAGAESRAYYLNGTLAMLERAIIRYTLEMLIKNGFQLVSVPDVLNQNILQKCGFLIDHDKNQLYNVVKDPNQLHSLFQKNDSNLNPYPTECLAGTSEMSLATYLSNTVLEKEKLPIKLCAVSRCYRREVSAYESHLYRVHQFNKVEMFCVTKPTESEEMLDYILDIQTKIISPLEFEFRILDMASEELGNSAFKKLDIEAWMAGEGRFGEISSTSNCTDYQSKKLNIFYETENSDLDFVHTLNGTGCAIPRMLKTIMETHTTKEGHVKVPNVLRKYMGNVEKITRQHPPHKLKWISKIVNSI